MNESKMFMSSTICVNACRSSSPDESESTDANIAFTSSSSNSAIDSCWSISLIEIVPPPSSSKCHRYKWSWTLMAWAREASSAPGAPIRKHPVILESAAPRDGPLLAGAPAPAPATSMAKSAAPSFAKRPFKAGAGAPAVAPAAVTYALAAPAEAPAAAPADEPPAPSRPPMSAAVSFRRRSKFGSFNEGDSVIRTQPLPAAPHPDTYDPEDYPAELGHHFRPLVYKLADAVADALAE